MLSTLNRLLLILPALTTQCTPLGCREAEAAGCGVVTGEMMFVGQAADQFRLFTGVEPPVELMRRVLLDSLQQQ